MCISVCVCICVCMSVYRTVSVLVGVFSEYARLIVSSYTCVCVCVCVFGVYAV